MYITQVKRTKFFSPGSTLLVPSKGYIVFFLGDPASGKNTTDLLIDFFQEYLFRGIRRLIIPQKLVLIASKTGNQEHTATIAVPVQNFIARLVKANETVKIPPVSAVLQSNFQSTVLIDVTPHIKRFYDTRTSKKLLGRTSTLIYDLVKIKKQKPAILVLAIDPEDFDLQRSFLHSLVLDIRRLNKEHNVFNLDYFVVYIKGLGAVAFNTRKLSPALLISGLINVEKLVKNYKDTKPEDALKQVLSLAKRFDLVKKAIELTNLKPQEARKLIALIKTFKQETKDLTKAVTLGLKAFAEIEVTGSSDELTDLTEQKITAKKVNIQKLESKILHLLTLNAPDLQIENPTDSIATVPKNIPLTNYWTKPELYEAYIKSFVDIASEYWKVLGYDVKLVDMKPVTESPSFDEVYTLYTLKFKVKTPAGKTIDFELDIPRFDKDGYTWAGKTKRILLTQLYQPPIVSYLPHETTLRTNYAVFRIRYLSKYKTKIFEGELFRTKIPATVLAGAFACSLKRVLELCNFEVDVIPQENWNDDHAKKYTAYETFGKYVYAFKNKLNSFQQAVLNDLKVFKKYDLKNVQNLDFDKIDTEDCKGWETLLTHVYSPMFALQVLENKHLLVDLQTQVLLKLYNQPYTPEEIVVYMMQLAFDGRIIDQNDIRFRRARDYELIGLLIYKLMNLAFIMHSTKLGGESEKLSIDRKILIRSLLVSPYNSLFVMPNKDYNPHAYVQMRARTAYTGPDGPSFPPLDLRNLHPSMKCIIDPVDTPEHDTAGEKNQLSLSAKVKNVFGQLTKDDQCLVFSISSALVPLTTTNDGNRVQMGANQLRQNVPLVHNERPLVSTGAEFLIRELSPEGFVIRSNHEGKVVQVTDKVIQIKTKDGKLVTYYLDGMITQYSYIEPKPIVKEGQVVKPGQIIAEYPNFYKNKLYAWGVNARVALVTWRGFSIEDAGIVREGFTKKLTSLHVVKPEQSTIIIPDIARLRKGVKEHKEVKAGEVLLEYEIDTTALRGMSMEALNEIRRQSGTLHGSIEVESEGTKIIFRLRSPERGRIKQIIVGQSQKGLVEKFPDIKELYDKQMSLLKTLHKDAHEVVLQPYTEKLFNEVTKLKDKTGSYIIVRFIITYEEPATYGDKLHNRVGNKMTIGTILPDELMARDEEGPFDVLLNPFGIVSRKNFGQWYELYLAECAYKIEQRIKDLVSKKQIKEALKLIEDTYKIIDEKQDVLPLIREKIKADPEGFIKDVINNGFTLIIPPGRVPSTERIKELMKFAGVPEFKTIKVYVPEIGDWIKVKARVGRIYIGKLEQRVKTKFGARSIGAYSRTGQAVAGGTKGGGQRAGEFDSWAILGHDSFFTTLEIFGPLADDHETKQQLIEELVKTGHASLQNKSPKFVNSELLKLYLLGIHALEF